MKAALLVLAVALGLVLAFFDTRPGWDDTGVTVVALLLATAALGGTSPALAWLWALAVGAWIPAVNVALTANYGALLALPIAFVGAYAGAAIRRTFGSARL